MSLERLQNAYVPDEVPEEDLRHFEKGGHGARMGWGDEPALLVVDMTKEFTSGEFPLGRSDVGQEAVEMNALLLEGARDADIPIIYTKINNRHAYAFSSLSEKKKEGDPTSPDTGNQIYPDLEPHNDDIVIEKHHASAFFDTHLGNILRRFGHEVRGCDVGG